ncbi:MAG: hypothetical protein C4318_07300 [Acidimicrobiia bacterium]
MALLTREIEAVRYEHPFVVTAIAIWAASTVMAITAAVLWWKSRADRAKKTNVVRSFRLARMSLYTASLALFGTAVGVGVYLAGPGEIGNPSPIIEEPALLVSPDASPLLVGKQPTISDSADDAVVTKTSAPLSNSRLDRARGPYKISFDSIGDVRVGDTEESITAAFGDPTGVRPNDSLGRTTKAFVYEEQNLSLTIYTFEGRVIAFSAGLSNDLSHRG